MLYEEIRRLFGGFVKASVGAIESRDPTTSGHSRRVAELTVFMRPMSALTRFNEQMVERLGAAPPA